ncbi:MAG: hypothetical protein JWQ38_158 [Flavipsychrobacter sp.]|nr:hypothetical protein [Flavipsychrobacter sp.]
MKKQFLLLAGTAIILASCGSNETPPAQTQAQIDSAVNAKLAEQNAANAAKNDSTLKAIEAEKAAAMAKETESKTTSTTKHTAGKTKTKTVTETKTVEPTPVPPPATIGNGKPKMTGQPTEAGKQDGTIGNGKPKMK